MTWKGPGAFIMPEKKAEEVPNHPSEDRSGRFAVDALLRSKGFHIAWRPKGKKNEPEWIRFVSGKWKVYKQSAALKFIDKNELADAIYSDDLLKEGFL
jgi:hypothetical protein